jgi:hypothetical protein
MKSIGFTFDEKVLKSKSLSGFLNQLPQAFKHLELAADFDILNKAVYKEISKKTLQSNFHIPYFLSHKHFDFAYRNYKDYDDFFSLFDYLRPYSKNKPFIVVHGSSEKNPLQGHESDKRGLDYLLNFMVKRKIDGILCLENLSSISQSSNYIENVYKLVSEFNHPQLKICYDLAHDYYDHPHYKFPRKEILEAISYYHVHGMHTKKHQDLKNLPKEVLNHLDETHVINLELLIEACENDYTQTLINNLSLLSQI